MLQLFVCAVGMTAVTLAAAVAQRDRTESQLRASERRYRALVQATPQVIWTTASVSSWWRDLTGQTEAESAGSGWLDAVHPEDRDRVRGAWAHAFESRTPYDVEYRLRTRAGAYRHYAVRGVALLDAHGRLEEWVGTLTDVDDRKQHEHQLRAWNETLEHRVAERTAALEVSEQRFRAIFHSQFQFIGLMSPDGTLVEANRTALAAAGVPETAVLGRPFWETAWWAHDRYQQERLKEAVRRAAAGRPDRFEASHPTAAGGLIWVDFSITPFYDEQGRVSLLIPEGRDITDRKRVEAALEEQEERFRNAFEFAPIGMALVGTDGRWLRVNQSICEILGFSEAELLATDFQTITHPDDLNADLGYVQQVLDGTINSYQMEKRYLHNRGHVVDVLLSVSLVRTPTREPLYFISQIQDVTKRTAAERALRSSEERFRLLVEGATDYGIFQLDRAGTIVNWNSGAQRINGYGAEEIIGRHFSVFYPHETVAAGHPEHELAVALARGRYHEEGERVRKDGSRLWASVTITALRDHAGEHVGFVKITQDITDRKTAEEQIRASLREKEVMLREIHHRVKNNLAVISSLFGLQARSLNDGASVRALREAQDRVLSMALVHQHLYNSADLGAVAFGEYARTLAGQVFQVNHLPTSEIKLELDVEAVRLSIDQAIPCGLILNELLSNCLKHAFRDRPGGRILLTLSVQDTVCRLRVADDGAGMPAELDVRSAKSLGVRLVRTLARQLDGTIEYRPTGPGTEALFTFPLVTGPKGKPSLPTPHPNVRTPSGGKTPSTE
jgi:PAS domain S-box-containing protein